MTARVLLFLLMTSAAGAAAGAADDLEQAARDAVAAKRFRDAVAMYGRLSERNPGNAGYLIWIGRLSGWLQDYAAALDAYDRALARAPQHVEALIGKATVLMWQQKFSEAERDLAQAERLAPDSVDVQLAFARYDHYQRRESAAYARVLLALALEPSNDEARALRSQIVLPRPLQVTVGYGRDEFSFAGAGHAGSLAAGYVGDRRRVTFQYERWRKFAETVDRAGLTVSSRAGERVWIRGSAMVAPGAEVLARQDYSAGFSRSWPGGLVIGADYRRLELTNVHVDVASPAVDFYLPNRPVWLQAVFARSWTRFDAPAGAAARNASFLLRYNEQFGEPVVVHAGYARGNESFAALSIDRIGTFRANTYSGGVDVRVGPACSLAFSFASQRRSSGASQQTFGISASVRQ